MPEIVRLCGSDPKADFDRLAYLHTTSIFHGVLPLLGKRFLAALYLQIAETPGAGVWVARQDSVIVGFVAGCRDMPAAFRHILARGWVRLAFKAATQLWRPTVWRKVASLALYPIRSRSGERNSDGRTEGSPPEPVEAELLAIAVAASARGGGVGRRLVEAFEHDLLRPSGVKTYIVTTNWEDTASNSFYRRLGFEPRDSFKHHDLVLQRYSKSIR
jgi:ribosomal protein S18 acetylase RimI-like enzyme